MILVVSGHRDLHDTSVPIIERTMAIEAPRATVVRFGGAIGVDTVALEVCCYLRSEVWPDLLVIVPHRVEDQPLSARAVIETCADKVIELDLPREGRSALDRNDALLDSANRLVAFTDRRTTGGTWYTIERAKDSGIEVEIVEVRTSKRRRSRKRRR